MDSRFLLHGCRFVNWPSKRHINSIERKKRDNSKDNCQKKSPNTHPRKTLAPCHAPFTFVWGKKARRPARHGSCSVFGRHLSPAPYGDMQRPCKQLAHRTAPSLPPRNVRHPTRCSAAVVHTTGPLVVVCGRCTAAQPRRNLRWLHAVATFMKVGRRPPALLPSHRVRLM